MKSFSEINSQEKMELSNRIKTLGKWLYLDLGLKDTIREIFYENGWSTKINSDEISKFMVGLESIKKTSMSKDYIDYTIRTKTNGVSNLRLVKDGDGNWHPVNKLNTNHSDLSDMLSELIMRARIINPDKAESFYQDCLRDPKSTLLKIRGSLKPLLKKYFTLEDFKKFTRNSIRQSKIGEESENKIRNILEKSGFKIEYSGGDGDFIDMLFGVDMVIWREDFGFKTVQIKTNMPELDKVKYYKVDWIGVASSGTLIDKTTGEKIDLGLSN